MTSRSGEGRVRTHAELRRPGERIDPGEWERAAWSEQNEATYRQREWYAQFAEEEAALREAMNWRQPQRWVRGVNRGVSDEGTHPEVGFYGGRLAPLTQAEEARLIDMGYLIPIPALIEGGAQGSKAVTDRLAAGYRAWEASVLRARRIKSGMSPEPWKPGYAGTTTENW